MKKSVVVFLSVAMLFSAAFGGGCGKKEDSARTLYVEVMVAGYGSAWAYDLADIFEEEHPGITVKITEIVKDSSLIVNKVMSGSTHLDLIFVEDRVESKYDTPVTASDGTVYAHPFADISDIYAENVPGESVTLQDKMLKSVFDYLSVRNEDGTLTQYSVPWMKSLNGIVVNKNVYEPADGKWPNTTDEFFEFCDNLPSDVTPMIHSISTSYWDTIYPTWLYQYYGSETMALYRRGYNPDDLSQLNQPEMFYSDGLLEALKVYEKLVNPDNGYVGKTQAQINNTSLDFTSVQNKFLETQNKILFCPNGLWLEREMEANYDPEELNVEFIKTPVLSALSEQLSYYSETRGYSELSAAEKEKYDAVLSDIIDYVDGTSTEKPKFNGQDVSDADIERVRDARAFNSAAYNFNSVIPAYSTKIDLAKEFLQLMATDRGLEAMYAACGGSAPFEYGKSKLDALHESGVLSDFTYSANKLILEGQYTFGYFGDLFSKNNLWDFNMTNQTIAAWFAAPSANDRVSAQELWYEDYEYVKGMWPTYLRTAGIEL